MKNTVNPPAPLLALSFCLALVLVPVAGAQQTESADAASEQQTPAGEGQEEGGIRIGGIVYPEPPDGVWLKDEKGEYFIDKTPKIENWYTWIDRENNIVRPRNLPPIKVEYEDDQYFYFKVYKPTPFERAPEPEEAEPLPTPELVEVDRLRLEPFDRGLPEQGQWRNGFEVVDMNGDDHLDLVHGPARKGQPVPSVFLGDSAGNWRAWDVEVAEAGLDYGDIAVADFNGDGVPDLALAVHLRGIRAFVGDGGGGFEPWSEGLPLRKANEGVSAFSGRVITSTDWNGDGRPDLLSLSEGPTGIDVVKQDVEPERGLRIFLNQGDGSWKAMEHESEDTIIGDHILVVDLDRDGVHDVVTDSRNLGFVGLLRFGRPDGTLEMAKLEGLLPRAVVWAVAEGDVDGDGDVDLAVSWRRKNHDQLELFLNQGDGRSWRVEPVIGRDDGAEFRSLAMGDVDGDGRTDLAAGSGEGSVFLFLRDEQGGWQRERAEEMLPQPAYNYCTVYSVQLVDLDGDGRDEIVASFAGEPGSEILFRAEPRCRAGGALRVWRAAAEDAAPKG